MQLLVGMKELIEKEVKADMDSYVNFSEEGIHNKMSDEEGNKDIS